MDREIFDGFPSVLLLLIVFYILIWIFCMKVKEFFELLRKAKPFKFDGKKLPSTLERLLCIFRWTCRHR